MPSNSWKIKSTTMRNAWQPGPSASQFGTMPSDFGVVRHYNAESGFVTCLLLRGLQVFGDTLKIILLECSLNCGSG